MKSAKSLKRAKNTIDKILTNYKPVGKGKIPEKRTHPTTEKEVFYVILHPVEQIRVDI